MRQVTVEQAQQLQNGEVIPSISGRLIKLFKPNQTQYGELQNGELQDSTGTMKITFADITQPMSARNSNLTLSCYDGNHGLTGVKIKDDKEGSPVIWVTGTANIEYDGAQAAPGRQERGATRQRGDTPPPRGRGDRSTTQAAPARPTIPPQKQLELLADLQLECVKLADARIRPLLEVVYPAVDEKKSGEANNIRNSILVTEITKLAISLFIQASQSSIVQVWIEDKHRGPQFPPAPEDPTQWRKCVIPKGKNAGQTLEQADDATLKLMADFYDEKADNSDFAECVYEAARERNVEGYGAADPLTSPADEADDVPF